MRELDDILLIEDNPGDARLVATYLEGLGRRCTLRQAPTLAAGIRALREQEPAVVLLDLGLPDSQGLAGYVELARHAPGTAVVILTGHASDDAALEALGLGADDFLAKDDVDAAALLRAMRHALRRRARLADELSRLAGSLEDRVARRTAALEAENADLATTGRTLGHDLRTPLNGILGMTMLVRQEAQPVLSPTALRRLDLVEKSAHEMNALIANLVAAATTGAPPLHRVELDLSAMAGAIARQLDAADPSRRVDWRIEPGLVARGERVGVTRVLQNLLENAWKYTAHAAHPVVGFGRDAGGGAVPVFEVRDNGVGFETDDAADLFEPLRRLPSARAFPGTGLGLASVRRIVERHGGRIRASGQPGRGAVFRFTLQPADARPDGPGAA